MSNGKSLSGSVSGYLERVKQNAKDTFVENVKGRVNDMVETVGNTVKDEIIKHSRNTMKDAAKLAQEGQDQINGIWKNRDQIIERIPDEIDQIIERIPDEVKDKVEDVTKAAQDKLKNADESAKGIASIVQGTAGNKMKDLMMKAQDQLRSLEGVKAIENTVKSQAHGQIDKIWKNRDEIIEIAGNKVKDVMMAQDPLKIAADGAKAIKDAVKGHGSDQLDKVWRNRDQIMKTAENTAKDAAKMAQDKLKQRVEDVVEDAAKMAHDKLTQRFEDAVKRQVDDEVKWTNHGKIIKVLNDVTKKTQHGEIIEATRNMVKDVTMNTQENLKNAHDGVKAIKDTVKGQGHGQIDKIWKSHDRIIETAGNKVKDVTMMAQDKLKNVDSGANAIKDAVRGPGHGQIDNIWRNHGQIIESAGNKVKDARMLARDELKNAGNGEGIKDGVKGQVNDQIDNVWKNHDKIIDVTGNVVKDVTKVAVPRGIKGKVESQIDKIFSGKIF
jgi:enamine deaminase RidA (YjgF/YER057c/UK114 family)